MACGWLKFARTNLRISWWTASSDWIVDRPWWIASLSVFVLVVYCTAWLFSLVDESSFTFNCSSLVIQIVWVCVCVICMCLPFFLFVHVGVHPVSLNGPHCFRTLLNYFRNVQNHTCRIFLHTVHSVRSELIYKHYQHKQMKNSIY